MTIPLTSPQQELERAWRILLRSPQSKIIVDSLRETVLESSISMDGDNSPIAVGFREGFRQFAVTLLDTIDTPDTLNGETDDRTIH